MEAHTLEDGEAVGVVGGAKALAVVGEKAREVVG